MCMYTTHTHTHTLNHKLEKWLHVECASKNHGTALHVNIYTRTHIYYICIKHTRTHTHQTPKIIKGKMGIHKIIAQRCAFMCLHIHLSAYIYHTYAYTYTCLLFIYIWTYAHTHCWTAHSTGDQRQSANRRNYGTAPRALNAQFRGRCTFSDIRWNRAVFPSLSACMQRAVSGWLEVRNVHGGSARGFGGGGVQKPRVRSRRAEFGFCRESGGGRGGVAIGKEYVW